MKTCCLLLISLLLLTLVRSKAAEQDLQLWMPVQVVHPFGEAWSISMQAELRLQDDISEFSQFILKPAVNYHFDEHWALSIGYKYIDKYESFNENDFWQELHYNWKYHDLIGGYQLRLEERFLGGIDNMIPRLRFLVHAEHPICDTEWYTTGWAAVRFNMGSDVNSRGNGPVTGFEQSRIFAGIGRNLNPYTKIELGYLWRYQRERVRSDLSDHVIQIHLVFNTKGKLVKHPGARDKYR